LYTLVLVDIKPIPAPRHSVHTSNNSIGPPNEISENNNNSEKDSDTQKDNKDKEHKTELVRRIAGKKISALFEV
jgi:hypothetical protein